MTEEIDNVTVKGSGPIGDLKKGDKIKVELTLKGRERAKPEMARVVLNNFIEKSSTCDYLIINA